MAFLFVLSACSAPAECVDDDLDGYGPGCELGEDCDPNNAARFILCETVPPPDCDADRMATGCPCLPGSYSPCLEETHGVGICQQGYATCVNRFWGLCVGGVAPISERCDGVDQDCDGLVDEAVTSPCGGCTPGCLGGVWGEGDVPFEVGPGLALTRLGELTLATEEILSGVVWIANTADGTLSRIDAASATETARYPTGGTEPSRVAVDYRGDAWVVNREFGGVPSVTKIAGELERCVDRDLDGAVQTSTGPDDVRPLEEDECVLFHAPVGELEALARAIAIDGDTGLDGVSGGDAWVGLHDAEAIVELEGLSGAELRRVETPGFSPYAATFDPFGTLFMIDRDGLIARIDPRPVEPTVEIIEVPLPCYLLYGLASDADGLLVMSGFGCDRIVSYDPSLELWATRRTPPSPRAVTIGPDGRFWMAHTGGMLSEIRLDPLRIVETHSVASSRSPLETIGVGVDSFGQVWTSSSQGGADGGGLVTRFDPEAAEVTAELTVGQAPHVQGDLTGDRVRHRLASRGSVTHVFGGCGPDVETQWVSVHVEASPGAGRVVGEIRHAASEAGLAAASWVELGIVPDRPAPWALSLPAGGSVEIRLTLEVDGAAGAPRVRRVGLEWGCPGPD